MPPENDGEQKTEVQLLQEEKASLIAKLEEQQKSSDDRAHAAEVAKASSEAALNAFKSALEVSRQGNTATVSEDQWKALEEKTGVSRDVFITGATISNQQIELAKKQLEERLKSAEDKASKAEQRAEKLSSDRSTEKILNEFYDQKPSMSRHRGVVKEFVDMFSEADKNDPVRLKAILDKAEPYVRGKVGGTLKLNSGSSDRFSNEGEEGSSGNEQGLDLIGLQTDVQKNTIRNLKASLDGDVRERDEKLLTKFESADKQGVAYSAESEWAEAKVRMK